MMDEKTYADKINSLEMELESCKRQMNNLEKDFARKLEYQNRILKSQNEMFDILFCESDLKAHGHLRDVQLQTFEILKFILKMQEYLNLSEVGDELHCWVY